MTKVLVANVSSIVNDNEKRNFEFELTELNKHLSEGWYIEKYDIVTNPISLAFSIIYQLTK
ncbi:hypothetical protein [Flavobacterium sp. WC2416]|uniref:DUF4177 domain-containing protein n=1 Tax=Flavobacterium sp. WC2416 TaxID=3234141 RepID=A0AB39W8Y4_9FLAO